MPAHPDIPEDFVFVDVERVRFSPGVVALANVFITQPNLFHLSAFCNSLSAQNLDILVSTVGGYRGRVTGVNNDCQIKKGSGMYVPGDEVDAGLKNLSSCYSPKCRTCSGRPTCSATYHQ